MNQELEHFSVTPWWVFSVRDKWINPDGPQPANSVGATKTRPVSYSNLGIALSS
jgi:hypothetical protein